jgi:hypothetical protein
VAIRVVPEAEHVRMIEHRFGSVGRNDHAKDVAPLENRDSDDVDVLKHDPGGATRAPSLNACGAPNHEDRGQHRTDIGIALDGVETKGRGREGDLSSEELDRVSKALGTDAGGVEI